MMRGFSPTLHLIALIQLLLPPCNIMVDGHTVPSLFLQRRQQQGGESSPPNAQLNLSAVPDPFEPSIFPPPLAMSITGYHPPWFPVDTVLDTAHKCLMGFVEEAGDYEDPTEEQPAACPSPEFGPPYFYLETDLSGSGADVNYEEAYHMLDGLTQFAWQWRDVGWVPSCSFTMDWHQQAQLQHKTKGEMRVDSIFDGMPKTRAKDVG